MRYLLILILLSSAVFAEDITTKDGKTYAGAKISKVYEDSVLIIHSAGMAKVDFKDLPDEIAKQYMPKEEKVDGLTEKEVLEIAEKEFLKNGEKAKESLEKLLKGKSVYSVGEIDRKILAKENSIALAHEYKYIEKPLSGKRVVFLINSATDLAENVYHVKKCAIKGVISSVKSEFSMASVGGGKYEMGGCNIEVEIQADYPKLSYLKSEIIELINTTSKQDLLTLLSKNSDSLEILSKMKVYTDKTLDELKSFSNGKELYAYPVSASGVIYRSKIYRNVSNVIDRASGEIKCNNGVVFYFKNIPIAKLIKGNNSTAMRQSLEGKGSKNIKIKFSGATNKYMGYSPFEIIRFENFEILSIE